MRKMRRPVAELGWTMQRKPFSVQTQTREKQPLLPPLTMMKKKVQRGDLLLWMARQQRQQLLFLLLQQRVCRQARVLPPLTRTRLETSITC